MKNHLSNKIIVGYIGNNSFLAKKFYKQYKNRIIFKAYLDDIAKHNKFKNWLIKNKDINILINFAAISSVKKCENNKAKALKINCKSVINILNVLNKLKMPNFEYFLAISSSHVFKKSSLKLKENSEKRPNNYYGFSKLSMEKFILKNYKKFFFKIGIARIFNYYNKNSKNNFFINDVINKFKKKDKIIKFTNINAYRDYISVKDINTALFEMINQKLVGDYNICSGKKIYLSDIVKKIHKKNNKKKVAIINKGYGDLIGSNSKLRRKGWKISNFNILNEL